MNNRSPKWVTWNSTTTATYEPHRQRKILIQKPEGALFYMIHPHYRYQWYYFTPYTPCFVGCGGEKQSTRRMLRASTSFKSRSSAECDALKTRNKMPPEKDNVGQCEQLLLPTREDHSRAEIDHLGPPAGIPTGTVATSYINLCVPRVFSNPSRWSCRFCHTTL